MKLVLSHSSALDLIRASRWSRVKLQPVTLTTLTDCVGSLEGVESIFVPAFDQSRRRLEVLVGDEAKRGQSQDHICHILKVQPIAGMFCKVGKNAYVTSPEMTFLQMTSRMPLVNLVMLGMEMCGTYASSPYGDYVDERPPITSKKRLLSFCDRARKAGIRGATAALDALRWVVDGSNSPAETEVVLFLCLPVRLGGYGFKYPDMNPETPLGRRESKMLGQPRMRCDLHWVLERVVIEYDSDQEHLTSQSASKDARRRNVLGYKNVTVITVRNPMITEPRAFDDVAVQLAKALGRRLRPRDLEFTKARLELRFALFPWLGYGQARWF